MGVGLPQARIWTEPGGEGLEEAATQPGQSEEKGL